MKKLLAALAFIGFLTACAQPNYTPLPPMEEIPPLYIISSVSEFCEICRKHENMLIGTRRVDSEGMWDYHTSPVSCRDAPFAPTGNNAPDPEGKEVTRLINEHNIRLANAGDFMRLHGFQINQ